MLLSDALHSASRLLLNFKLYGQLLICISYFLIVGTTTLTEAVAFKQRPATPAISRWTSCVKSARVILLLGCDF